MSGPHTDHHVHFLAAVAARLSIDVSAAGRVEDLLAAIEVGAPARGWVRAWGYEEWRLAGGRTPTASDLERALPGRPVVLHHRTGHAAVLSPAALVEVGATEHADGLLVDRHDILSRVPRLDPSSMQAAAARLSAEWEAAGVGAFTDATHTNGAAELDLLARWSAAGVIRQAVTAMVGPGDLASLPGHGAPVGSVRVGAVKLMPAAGRLGELRPQVADAHRSGFPVAIHVVEVDVLAAALDAFAASGPPPGCRDRIEHNALSLPEQVDSIAASGAVVVVNPSFLVRRRGKYQAQLTGVERGWLIRMASLVRAGVELRAGSDAPVAPSVPAEMTAAARAHPFSAAESLDEAGARRLLSPLDEA